jgi:hypothetical protein
VPTYSTNITGIERQCEQDSRTRRQTADKKRLTGDVSRLQTVTSPNKPGHDGQRPDADDGKEIGEHPQHIRHQSHGCFRLISWKEMAGQKPIRVTDE